MRIGITAEWVGASAGGPERYTVELLKGLAALRPDFDITVYHCTSAPREWLASLPHEWTLRPIGSSRRTAIPVGLPLELVRRPVDLCHATYVMPPITPCRYVLTILDVGFESHPEHFPWLVRRRLSMLTSWGASRAAHIITISEDAKGSIMRHYGVPGDRISVTPLAAGGQFSSEPDEDDSRIRERLGLPESYILYVGKIQARKNIARLLEAYDLVRREVRDVPKLVLVGDRTWKSDAIFDTLEERQLSGDVILSGRAREEDLPAIYRGAHLFVYPSLLEGFGLPPLEAMVSGVPVACSNAASIPEVVGDAAIQFDPLCIEEMAKAMRQGLKDEALRLRLVGRGSQRAKLFSWHETARRTLSAYELARRA